MFSNFLNVLSNATKKSEDMFSHGWMDIAGGISDCFYRVLWFLICALMQVIYTVEQAFYWLAGINRDYSYTNKEGEIVKGLDSLFPTIDIKTGNVSYGALFGNNSLAEITKVMLYLGVGMVVLFLAFAIIKGLFNNEGKTEVMVKSATWNTLKACVFMALAPAMILITLSTIMFFLNLVFSGIFSAITGGSSQSIAESIFTVCYTGKDSKLVGDGFVKSITVAGGSWGIKNGETGKASRIFIQFYDIKTLMTDDTWNNFKDIEINMTLNGNFNYFVAFVGGAFTFVALGLMCIRIGERLFNLIIDYILCIPAISTMPYDNGQRFSTWGQMFLGQVLNFSGSVLAMAVYLFVVSTVTGIVNSITTEHTELFKAVVNCIIIIGGAFTCVKAGTIVSQLIGQVASQQENNSLSQSMHLAQMGARATKTVAGAGAMAFGVGAMGTLKAMKQGKNTGNGTGGSTGTGGTGGIGGAINNLAGGGDNTPTGSSGGSSGAGASGINLGDAGSTSSKANVGEKISSANATGESSPLQTVRDSLTSAMATSGAEGVANAVSDSGVSTTAKPTRKRAFDKTKSIIGNGIKDLNSGVARGFVESARSSHMNPFAIAVGTATGLAGGLTAMVLKGAGYGLKQGKQAIGRSTLGRSKKFKNKVAGTENKAMYQENKILKAQYKQDLSKAKKNMSAEDYKVEKDKLKDDYKTAKKENANIHKERKKELKGEANVFRKHGDNKGNNIYTTKEKIKKLDSEYSSSPHELNNVSKRYDSIKQNRYNREAIEKSTKNAGSNETRGSYSSFTGNGANFEKFKEKPWNKQSKKHGRYTIKG